MNKILDFIILITMLFMQLFQTTCANEYAMKKTIAVDLDGVLDNYTKYTDSIPPIRESAKDFIISLSKDYDLILFTLISPKSATKWLIDNNIDKYFKDVTNIKPLATMYIDDRAINFNGNYDESLKEIENFRVYWKK